MPDAEWGNGDGQQHEVTMDSNGQQLIVSRNAADAAVTASNANANGMALQVTEGKTELNGDVEISNNHDLSISGNLSVHGGFIDGGDLVLGNALDIGGATAEAINLSRIGANDGVTIRHWLRVGQDQEGVSPGFIDANAGGEEPSQNLNIGTGGVTADMVISRNGMLTTIQSALQVGNPGAEGYIDAVLTNGVPQVSQDIKIGTGSSTANVILSQANKTVSVKGKLIVGNPDAEGFIDAARTDDIPAEPQNLNLGTDSGQTNDTIIGQENRNIKTPGHLLVGTSNNLGRIDAQGTDLNIGCDSTTENVVLGRDGKWVETEGVLSAENVVKLNFNDLILGSTLAANTGWGFHLDTINNRLEVWVNGNMAGYFDSAGWH